MDFNLNSGSFLSEEKLTQLDPNNLYDVIILGGGPAGLTAAVYCMRKGISTALIIKDIGGQVAETSAIENYMGYRYINGIELIEKFKEQVTQFGISYEENCTVKSIKKEKDVIINLEDGRAFKTKSLIVATGKSSRKLNVPGEKELTGKGVAYCSICDAPFYKEKKAVVVGGGNSGIEAAIDLSKVATEVTVIQFLDKLTGDNVLIDKLKSSANVTILYEYEIININGADMVESIDIKNIKTGETSNLVTDGIFIEIGLIPNSSFAKEILEFNQFNEIQIDCGCNTSVPGIFAAGDVTSVPFKQIIIAGGEGAKAALSAYNYVLMQK